MPSGFHEVVIELLRAAPDRAVELVRWVGVEVGAVHARAAVVVDPTVPQLVSPALASDLVIEVEPEPGEPGSAIVVEVQRGIDRGKELTWPVTWATARQRVGGGRACLVVITDHAGVGAWAQRVLADVIPTAGRWSVLDPRTMPRITDPGAAATAPEAAAVSALIHAGDRDDDLVPAIAATCSTLSDERGMLIYDVLLARLTARAVGALEALMQKQAYEWQSEFARRHRAEGRAEGEATARAAAIAELREALEVVLSLRGLELTEEQRAQVADCRELVRFRTWIRRAATATATVQLFEA